MSAQESCLSLIKYFLFVFNLFFFVLGSLIFCFGIWILIDKTSFVSFVGLAFVPLQIWSKVLAISGIFTMGLALLGCVGALKELRCLLGLYFGVLLLLFATQITLGILIATQRAQLERSVQDIVEKTIQNYRTNPEETPAEESWDYVQFQLRCCGWHSPQDWFRVHVLRGNGSETHRVPCSCYNLSATNDSTILDNVILPQLSRLGPRSRHSTDICAVPVQSHIHREGCAQSLRKWLHNNLISIVGICLGVGLLEMTVMVLSVQLQRRALRRKREPHVPGARGSSPGPSLIADSSGGGRCGVLSSSGRNVNLWSGWGMAGACPNWGDKAPQGKLPMALGPWPLWVQDVDQPDTGIVGAELETEAELEAEAEGETDEPPE
uniref:leukocyte antigen CD37 isoform X2 n=2 Tax=Callithrix jacchus TaxID=9483 RepID=UPI0023DD2DA6|nr:leukocyte antigen CD37 isoform X2 [Callithrix jacchus]XP_035142988.2 leukocyte antigen CD37 isoform X2 [Callithrix jacchus]XP_035142989.2 leukocyte antigen CD37 isoform X2 [Callithrix jacchus]XP_035142990.2 leukocyte antigen CD37 isoform X2 [Callithrix jacchus]XP_054105317.1 leukocyte antigen CD37 isoform X2 [Callithrix jacchus]